MWTVTWTHQVCIRETCVGTVTWTHQVCTRETCIRTMTWTHQVYTTDSSSLHNGILHMNCDLDPPSLVSGNLTQQFLDLFNMKSTWSMNLRAKKSRNFVVLRIYIYLYLSIYRSIYLSIHLSISIYLYLYLSISIYLSIYLQKCTDKSFRQLGKHITIKKTILGKHQVSCGPKTSAT